MNPNEFAAAYLAPFKLQGAEIKPVYCPFCHGGEHRDKYTFALNFENKTFNCKRGKCGRQGHFTELCREMGVEADKDWSIRPSAPKREYKKPETKPVPLSLQAEKYIASRGISPATMYAYGISCDEKCDIMFPYYNANGEHVFTKFRKPFKLKKGEQKMWRDRDTMPILFGMNLCDPEYPLVITEGEFDAMACHEAGVKNAVSVPSGAQDFTWLDTCWEWLEGYREIVLFGDNDETGRKMVSELSAKLSDHKISIVDHKSKDANELLHREGRGAVLKAVQAAREVMPLGLLNLGQVEPFDPLKVSGIPSGIRALDKKLGGFMPGDVSVWTGKRGEGKSTFLSGVMLDALNAGFNVCAYSGELRVERFQYWCDLQAAGIENIEQVRDERFDRTVCRVYEPIAEMIHKWYDGRYYIYDNTVSGTPEETGILRIFELAAKRYDCKVFLVDNLMTAKYAAAAEADYYRAQSGFMGELVAFANKFNVHVHMVAHPRKLQQTSKAHIDNDDISGTGDITNRASNVFSIEKLTELQKSEAKVKGDEQFDTGLVILKNRWDGTTGKIGLNFCPVSRRLYQKSEGADKVYGWNKEIFNV